MSATAPNPTSATATPANPAADAVDTAAGAAKPGTPAGTTVKAPDQAAAAAQAAAREAEYQAALAAARGEKPKPAPKAPVNEEDGEIDHQEDETTIEADGEDADDLEAGEAGSEGEDGETRKGAKVKKFKVLGKEVEVDYADEKRVDELVSKGLASDEKFQHAAKIQRNAEAFIGNLRDNPFAVLTNPKLGVDQKALRQAAERWLYEQVAFESAAPEEQTRILERRELEQRRAAERAAQERQKAKQREDLKSKFQQDMTKQFVESIEGSGLPVTDYTLQRMAFYMRAAVRRGMKTIRPADVVPLVKRDWQSTFQQLTSRYDGEKLVETFGEEAAKKIRQAHLAKVRGQGANNADQERNPAPRAVRRPANNQPTFSSAEDMRDWHEANRRRG